MDKIFQNNNLKLRIFKARARSRRHLRAAESCAAIGQWKESKKYIFRAVFIYPPLLLRKAVFARFLFSMLSQSQYEILRIRVHRLTAFFNLKKPIKMLISVLRGALMLLGTKHHEELIIIVPFRDREENLKQFIPHMRNFLRNVKHRIVVIEQSADGVFNKAKLLNVGFTLYQDANAYFCFHDVDLLPESKSCDYSYPVMPTHLAAYCSQFEYQFYPGCFGGVILVNKADFRKVNGYSNQYLGWGGEDDDLIKRFDQTWTIPRTQRMGRYNSIERLAFGHILAHENVKRRGNPHYQKNCLRLGSGTHLPYDTKTDGLSDLKFELLKTIEGDGFVKHIIRL